ncbi:MAG: VWA domain-containing protein [Clostridia bacterium]|nr:VWA domain-containing protein [Clostridia bacterium]
MKTNLTELVFILDRSGSMAGLESDTIGGYNGMLEKQKKEAGEVKVTTVLFDDYFEVLHDRIDLKELAPITEEDYFVRGSTALLDAVGKTIDKVGNGQKHTKEQYRADKVLFVITTDGMENASHEYSYDRIKKMIIHQKEVYHWEFLFLGANIDAIETAGRFGIDSNRAVNYCADQAGTKLNYEAVSQTVSNFRMKKAINDNWKEEIERDHSERGKK